MSLLPGTAKEDSRLQGGGGPGLQSTSPSSSLLDLGARKGGGDWGPEFLVLLQGGSLHHSLCLGTRLPPPPAFQGSAPFPGPNTCLMPWIFLMA